MILGLVAADMKMHYGNKPCATETVEWGYQVRDEDSRKHGTTDLGRIL